MTKIHRTILTFLNRSRKYYRGMEIQYDSYYNSSGYLTINMKVNGEFPLPIMCHEFFDNMLDMFLDEDMKLFGVKYQYDVLLGDVYYNGQKINDNELILREDLRSGIDEIIYKNKERISLETVPSVILERNTIDFSFKYDGTYITFEFDVVPRFLTINGKHVGESEIWDFVQQSSDYHSSSEIVEELLTYINHAMDYLPNKMSNNLWDLLESFGVSDEDPLIVRTEIETNDTCYGIGNITVDNPGTYPVRRTHELLSELIEFLKR